MVRDFLEEIIKKNDIVLLFIPLKLVKLPRISKPFIPKQPPYEITLWKGHKQMKLALG